MDGVRRDRLAPRQPRFGLAVRRGAGGAAVAVAAKERVPQRAVVDKEAAVEHVCVLGAVLGDRVQHKRLLLERGEEQQKDQQGQQEEQQQASSSAESSGEESGSEEDDDRREERRQERREERWAQREQARERAEHERQQREAPAKRAREAALWDAEHGAEREAAWAQLMGEQRYTTLKATQRVNLRPGCGG